MRRQAPTTSPQKATDAASNTSAASTALAITVDTTAPTYSSAAVTYTGSETENSKTYLNATDTIAVAFTFSETLGTTQPTVQFKNNTTNLGSAVTATGSGTVRTATYTVASTDTVAEDNLKYDLTNESSLTDVAGNALSGTVAQVSLDDVIIDTTTPTITTTTGGTNDTRTVSAADNETGTTMEYKLITGTCNAAAMTSGTTAYTEGNDITIAAADNGKKVCFSSEDTAGNTTLHRNCCPCLWCSTHRYHWCCSYGQSTVKRHCY